MDVLVIVVDSLCQIVFGDGDIYGMGIFVDDDCCYFGWSYGVDYELCWVVVLQDDVYLFFIDFVGYCLDV